MVNNTPASTNAVTVATIQQPSTTPVTGAVASTTQPTTAPSQQLVAPVSLLDQLKAIRNRDDLMRFKHNLGQICKDGVTRLVFVIAFNSSFIAAAIVGLIYNNCPIQWRIPLYLTLLGFSEIGVSLLDLFHYVIKRCTGHNQNAIHATVDNVITQVDPKKSDNLAFAIIYYLLIVFRLIWFIAGSVWVFGADAKVQFSNPKLLNYCDSASYHYSLVLLSIQWIVVSLLFVLIFGICFLIICIA